MSEEDGIERIDRERAAEAQEPATKEDVTRLMHRLDEIERKISEARKHRFTNVIAGSVSRL